MDINTLRKKLIESRKYEKIKKSINNKQDIANNLKSD